VLACQSISEALNNQYSSEAYISFLAPFHAAYIKGQLTIE